MQNLAGPAEGLIKSLMDGNKGNVAIYSEQLQKNLGTIVDKLVPKGSALVTDIAKDVATVFSETYKNVGNPENKETKTVTHKHEGTLILKGEGNVNGVTQRNINDLLSDPSNASQTNFLLNGGSEPSAATGKKN
jgi:hypothetical protein